MRIFPKLVPALIASCLVFLAGAAVAQETSTRTVNFEIVSVDGNTIVWKDPAGVTKEFVAPPNFTLTMDGKQLGVAELKPGMKGSAVITTTTTHKPVVVSEVRNAEVLAVSGNAIVVRQDGKPRKYTQADVERRKAKLYRSGVEVALGQFRVGDRLSATIITDGPPETVTESQVAAMVQPAAKPAPVAAAPPPPAPAPAAEPAPAPEPAEAPADTLPSTASPMPLIGLLGALSLAAGFALRSIRRSREAR
jgi:hypothetical protein